MGLEIVELFMRLEEEFDMDIPDEDAVELHTIGNIADYIVEKKQILPEKQEEFWAKLKSIVVDEVSVPSELVERDARMVEDLGLG